MTFLNWYYKIWKLKGRGRYAAGINVVKLVRNIVVIALVTMFCVGCATATDDIVVIEDSRVRDAELTGEDDAYKIYLITMDLADDFWKTIDSGCREAVEELGGIDYKWIGPDVNEDAPQAECIEQAVAEGADAIVIAASSLTGVNGALEKAKAAGVKIIFVDNAADFDYVAFLATDNELAGAIAGETMQKALSEAGITSGTIGITVNKANVISTANRVRGFRSIFEGTNFTLDDTFFMEDEPQRIKDYVAEHPEYVAWFGSNERTALALGEQMRDTEHKQLIVGFDTSDAVLTLLYDGILYASLQQNPKAMGYGGIEIAVKSLQGIYPGANVKVDTGVRVLYKDSI